MATTVAAPTRPTVAAPKPKLPAGLKWSDVWETKDGLVRGTRELPVDAQTLRIAGQLYLCQRDECQTEEWIFEVLGRPRFCPDHGAALVPTGVDPNNPDAVNTARVGLRAKVRDAVIARRDRAIAEATARADALWKQAENATKRQAADMRGHIPSVLATAACLTGAGYVQIRYGLFLTVAAGFVVGTAGTVIGYLAAYRALIGWYGKKAKADEQDDLAKKKIRRQIRSEARQIAAAVMALGVWTIGVAFAGVNPATITGAAAILVGLAGGWAVNRRHWETLWATRRRIRDLERLKAEALARRAQEEADRLARGPADAPAEVVEEDTTSPEAVGRRIAAQWKQIAEASTVPSTFPMRRTSIVPEETRLVTIPGDDGDVIPIGYEFSGVCEPGALVARPGMQPPLLAAGDWLASMFERDPATLSLVDRPNDDEGRPRPNRFLLLITERAPLGAGVPWKGKAGVRRGSDGTIYVHAGRTLQGNDVEEAVYSPGRAMGGLTVGTVGGGKSYGTILRILNFLAAGIFPILDDPKNLVDYADFIGVFPIGVTLEHAFIIVNAMHAERQRRERHLSTRPITDRFGRERAAAAVWDVERDGPPIMGIFEEFHTRSKVQAFTALLTEQVRFQRAAAMGADAITQGGGLADMANSDIRGLLATTRLRLYRMADNLARLAGYTGDYRPSALPRVPGVCLDVTAEAPPLPLRAAFVTRDDVDGSVYDQLYAPDGTPLLTAPALPKETWETFRKEGLIDLWNLGKGPNGLNNLLSGSTTNYAPVGPGGEQTVVGRMQAGDVLLAIISTTPGCARTSLQGHPTWATAPGWSKPPDLSTVSRAITKLTKDGLISHADGVDFRITTKGEERAAVAARALFGQTAIEDTDEEAAAADSIPEGSNNP